jgi:vacuolar-type H+-ATPase subunit I/STV1
VSLTHQGIVSNTIKEILEMLQADGLVQSEKVGTSHYFFRFPKVEDLATKKQNLVHENAVLEQKVHDLNACIERESQSRPESENRTKKLRYLSELQQTERELKEKLDKVSSTIRGVKQQKGVAVCKEAANRWTENIFALESYLRKEFQMDLEPLRKEFKIPADLDTF